MVGGCGEGILLFCYHISSYCLDCQRSQSAVPCIKHYTGIDAKDQKATLARILFCYANKRAWPTVWATVKFCNTQKKKIQRSHWVTNKTWLQRVIITQPDFFVVALVVRKLPFIPFYCKTLNLKPPETAVRKKTLTAVTWSSRWHQRELLQVE